MKYLLLGLLILGACSHDEENNSIQRQEERTDSGQNRVDQADDYPITEETRENYQ